MTTAVKTRDDVKAAVKDFLGLDLDDRAAESAEVVKAKRADVREMGGEIARDGSVSYKNATKNEAGFALARVMRAHAVAEKQRGNSNVTPLDVLKGWDKNIRKVSKSHNERAIAALEVQTKGVQESVGADGGFLVPEDMAAEIIPLLTTMAVVRASGARSFEMSRGNYSMNFGSSNPTASYVGEANYIPPSTPQVGQLKLDAKKLAALVAMSNDLLRDGGPAVDAWVRDGLLKAMALREDLAFIRGTGASYTPKGIRNVAAYTADATDDGGSITVATVTNDLINMFAALDLANIPGLSLGILMHSRTKWFLMGQRGSDDQFIWRDEMQRGTLMGVPYRMTNQIPITLGGGAESELYLADFGEIMIGDSLDLEVRAQDGAAYNSDASTVVAGFSTDETVVRALARHDIGFQQRGNEAAVLTAVDWTN